jgi:hypothetical protein
MKLKTNANAVSEAGNAMMIVLIGVVLFAALMFTVSRSSRQGTGQLTMKNAQLHANDILAYAKKVERGVSRLRQRSISEVDLDFDNGTVAGYANAGCPQPDTEECKVFSPKGGAIQWQDPPPGVTTETWVISGSNYVNGLGAAGDATDTELLLILPNISYAVCDELNTILGIDGIPTEKLDSDISTKFTGTYSATPELIEDTLGVQFNGDLSGCYQGAVGRTPPEGTYHFFHVLLQRP